MSLSKKRGPLLPAHYGMAFHPGILMPGLCRETWRATVSALSSLVPAFLAICK
jgi:hypothetical protein